MTWAEALDALATHHHIERYRDLCAETWPDHAAYRALMIRLATGEPPPETQAEDKELRAYVTQHPCGGC
jgi:hypothetical protein